MFYRSKSLYGPQRKLFLIYLLISLKVEWADTHSGILSMDGLCVLYIRHNPKETVSQDFNLSNPPYQCFCETQEKKCMYCKWFASLFVIVYEYMYIQYKSTPRSFKFDRWVI